MAYINDPPQSNYQLKKFKFILIEVEHTSLPFSNSSSKICFRSGTCTSILRHNVTKSNGITIHSFVYILATTVDIFEEELWEKTTANLISITKI